MPRPFVGRDSHRRRLTSIDAAHQPGPPPAEVQAPVDPADPDAAHPDPAHPGAAVDPDPVGCGPTPSHSDEVHNDRMIRGDSVAMGAINAASTFLPVFIARLGGSAFEVGLLTAIPAVFAVMLAIPFGQVLQRQTRIVAWYSRGRLLGHLGYGAMALIVATLSPQLAVPAVLVVWAVAAVPADDRHRRVPGGHGRRGRAAGPHGADEPALVDHGRDERDRRRAGRRDARSPALPGGLRADVRRVRRRRRHQLPVLESLSGRGAWDGGGEPVVAVAAHPRRRHDRARAPRVPRLQRPAARVHRRRAPDAAPDPAVFRA